MGVRRLARPGVRTSSPFEGGILHLWMGRGLGAPRSVGVGAKRAGSNGCGTWGRGGGCWATPNERGNLLLLGEPCACGLGGGGEGGASSLTSAWAYLEARHSEVIPQRRPEGDVSAGVDPAARPDDAARLHLHQRVLAIRWVDGHERGPERRGRDGAAEGAGMY